MLQKINIKAFDGSHLTKTKVALPDRYRHLDELPCSFVSRGGGYSYSPLSFAGDKPSIGFSRFNRILRFDPDNLEIDVEAGITLAKLLAFLMPRGFWSPVIPGYPAITVGGCIAGDVHGKSQPLHGNFRNWVKRLALHKEGRGPEVCSMDCNEDLFNLTCGGLGLTGPIIWATLKLIPLDGGLVKLRRQSVSNLWEAYRLLNEISFQNEFAYSWHRPWSWGDRCFGQGQIFYGSVILGSPLPKKNDFEFNSLKNNASDRILPLSFFGGMGNWRTRLIHGALNLFEKKYEERSQMIFDSLFPFVRNRHYFSLYGQRGFREIQVLVPTHAIENFLKDFTNLNKTACPPAAFIALKLFRGKSDYLRYEGEGLSLAMDLASNESTDKFLNEIDRLCVFYKARPNPIKDSRLGREVFDACVPEAEKFRIGLRRYGLFGKYASHTAQRLGLA